MKMLSRKSSGRLVPRFLLAAGTLASLAALPQGASAQVRSGYMRPGAISSQPGTVATQNQPVQNQPPVMRQQMRPGPIVQGTTPIYRPAPTMNTGPVYSNAPVYSRGPVIVQSPVYGRGGSNYYGNGYNGNGYSSNGYNNGYSANPYYPSFGGSYGGVNLPPVGPANGFIPNPIPPVGPANGYFTNPIPPVGPANGFFSGQTPITGGGPALLGGYYYGNYCNAGAYTNTYPSVYSVYSGIPQYIYSPTVTVINNSYTPDYSTPYLPFNTPVYQTFYNQNNYYVATPGRVADLEAGGERAKEALQHAYPADSFQAAFADIAHAWTDGNLDLVRKHLRDPETRISVFLDGKYSYSIASNDFSNITRDALDRLHTVSFIFTRLRKAKNGDVTAFGAHVYHAADAGGAAAGDDTGTVPFDQTGTDADASSADQPDAPALGTDKTVYVSYTLRRYGHEWDIIATDSADHDLAAAAKTTE